MTTGITSVPGTPPDGSSVVATSGSLSAQQRCTRQGSHSNQSTTSTTYQNATAGVLATPTANYTGQKCLVEAWVDGGCTAGAFQVRIYNATDAAAIDTDDTNMATTSQSTQLQGVITLGTAGTSKNVVLQVANSGAGTSNMRRYYLKCTLVEA